MNERIKELAEQARDWGYAEHSGYTAQLLFEQKFAELIEQDCIDKFIKVWYEQGLDIRGAELDKFMLCYEELKNEK